MVDPNEDPQGALIHAVRGLAQVVQSLGHIYQIPVIYTEDPIKKAMAVVEAVEAVRKGEINEREPDTASAA